MVNDTTLTGSFVNLRPITPEDAALTLQWRQSDRTRYLNQGASTVEQQRQWILSRPASEYNFIIERKDGRPLGMVSLTQIDKVNRRAEPGRFLIGDEEAARGVPAAVEAMKLVYELAFTTLGLARVYGTVAEHNLLMIKWQKYLGMKEEGRLRRHLFLDGGFQDALCMGMLAEEYYSVALPRMNALIAAGK